MEACNIITKTKRTNVSGVQVSEPQSLADLVNDSCSRGNSGGALLEADVWKTVNSTRYEHTLKAYENVGFCFTVVSARG